MTFQWQSTKLFMVVTQYPKTNTGQGSAGAPSAKGEVECITNIDISCYMTISSDATSEQHFKPFLLKIGASDIQVASITRNCIKLDSYDQFGDGAPEECIRDHWLDTRIHEDIGDTLYFWLSNHTLPTLAATVTGTI